MAPLCSRRQNDERDVAGNATRRKGLAHPCRLYGRSLPPGRWLPASCAPDRFSPRKGYAEPGPQWGSHTRDVLRRRNRGMRRRSGQWLCRTSAAACSVTWRDAGGEARPAGSMRQPHSRSEGIASMDRWPSDPPDRSSGTLGAAQQRRRSQVGWGLARVCGGVAVVLALSMATSLILQVGEVSHVCSVAEVRAHLLERPGQWVGRTVRLSALLAGCPPTGDWGQTSCPPSF